MAQVHDLGRWGEEVAARYLADRGWRIRDRNVRFGARELDIVAQRGALIAFVEVKTRGPGPGHPLAAVDERKRRDIRTAAARWILAHGRPGWWYRFDVIAVRARGRTSPTIEHVENAWYDT